MKLSCLNFVELAKSEWASPIVFVSKKPGPLQLCMSYRKQNDMTVNTASPILRMEEGFNTLGRVRIFLKLQVGFGFGKSKWTTKPKQNGVRNAAQTVQTLKNAVTFGK